MLATDRFDYVLATTGSLVLHSALILAGLFFIPATSEIREIQPQKIIRAQLVSINDIKPPEVKPQQRVIDLTKAPPTPPPPPPRIPSPNPQPTPAKPPEPVKAETPKPTETPAVDNRAAREQQDLIQRQTDLSNQLDAELGALEEIENQQVVMSYASWISERVGNSWSRPPSARTGMVVKLRVNLVPTGRVVSVDIVESSGDDAFDRSAVQAVHKAEPFTKLTELSTAMFDEQFRQFYFVFNPQDLRL